MLRPYILDTAAAKAASTGSGAPGRAEEEAMAVELDGARRPLARAP
jgi:hypothetical protein